MTTNDKIVTMQVRNKDRTLTEVQAYLYSNWSATQADDGTITITGTDSGGFGTTAMRGRLDSGLIATEILT